MRRAALLLLALPLAAFADEIAAAKKRWADSPHGPMLERILPPTFEARQLPQSKSTGARLAIQYCVQCHNLPNPAMHHAEKWHTIVERMVLRMEGKGNLGRLMEDMMAGVKVPSAKETGVLVAYLQKNGQKPLNPKKYPEAYRAAGAPFPWRRRARLGRWPPARPLPWWAAAPRRGHRARPGWPRGPSRGDERRG